MRCLFSVYVCHQFELVPNAKDFHLIESNKTNFDECFDLVHDDNAEDMSCKRSARDSKVTQRLALNRFSLRYFCVWHRIFYVFYVHNLIKGVFQVGRVHIE